jgi:hypothetical protein
MIAGGSEAAITPMSVGGFGALRALSTRNDDPARASRPFDRDRDGFIIGEGAGVLILEELEHARSRGAKIDRGCRVRSRIGCHLRHRRVAGRRVAALRASGGRHHLGRTLGQHRAPARRYRAALRSH